MENIKPVSQLISSLKGRNHARRLELLAVYSIQKDSLTENQYLILLTFAEQKLLITTKNK
jgi:hypothetical protein